MGCMDPLMRPLVVALALALFGASPAFAGAWTLPRGDFQLILGNWTNSASKSFDDHGSPSVAIGYKKFLLQAFAEYGLTDSITLFIQPEYAIAQTGPPLSQAKDSAFGGGVRYRITDKIGVLSVQAMLKTAGAFNLSVSSHDASGRQAELRLLYGTDFKFWHRDGFVDFEIAERLVSGAAPNETPIDITVGLRVLPKYLVMLQSFNVVAGNDAKPPYTYYRTHKIELSVVYDWSPRFSMQSGIFLSPFGQNALQERGIATALWVHL
jgi:hypothetical protein